MDNIFTDSNISGLFQSITEIDDATAYKINVTFNRRLRIWQTQILPDRENAIHQENTVEFVHRMMDILFDDANRLTNRAIKEGATNNDTPTMMSRIDTVDTILMATVDIYIAEIDRIKLQLQGDK